MILTPSFVTTLPKGCSNNKLMWKVTAWPGDTVTCWSKGLDEVDSDCTRTLTLSVPWVINQMEEVMLFFRNICGKAVTKDVPSAAGCPESE